MSEQQKKIASILYAKRFELRDGSIDFDYRFNKSCITRRISVDWFESPSPDASVLLEVYNQLFESQASRLIRDSSDEEFYGAGYYTVIFHRND